MARLFNFFPQYQKREFKVKPRFYDPEKDRLEELKKKYDPQTSEEEKLAEAKVRIRESFQRRPEPKGVMGKRTLIIAVAATALLLFFILK